MAKKSYMEVTVDNTEMFEKLMERFKDDKVLVGVPAQNNHRDDGIGNASILAINEFGSPAQNIPARPVVSIGIRKARREISDKFKEAFKQVFEKGPAAIDQYYNQAGSIAASSIKKTINQQDGIKPPAEATLKSRKSRGFMGEKALLVSAQLRNSITWILKKGK